MRCLNSDFAEGFVASFESIIKSSIPARFYDEEIVTSIFRKKTEEMLDFAVISERSKISTAKCGVNTTFASCQK